MRLVYQMSPLSTECEMCKDLTLYIAKYSPDKCMMQQEAGEPVSDDEMDNYETVASIWINHYASHEGNY